MPYTEEEAPKRTSWNKGISTSPEVRLKISAANKGRKFSGEFKEKMKAIALKDGRKPPSQLGKKRSPETLLKMSNAFKGEKCNFWRGGIKNISDIRKSVEYKLWRKAVFERDNYTCI